jgi:hypothetical protein
MAVRILGWAIVLIVIVYHGVRIILTSCTGPSCDNYSPLTLLLPIAALILAGVAGGIAAYEARGRRGWPLVLGACAVAGSIGPIVLALTLKDNDVKVWVSTFLVLLVPITIGMSAAWRPSRIN